MKIVHWRLLKEAHANPAAFIGACLAGLAGVLAALVQARLLSQAIAQVFLPGKAVNAIQALLLLPVVILARAGFSFLSDLSASRLSASIKDKLRLSLSERLFAAGPARMRKENSGELTNLLAEGVEALDAYFSQYLPQLILALCGPLLILVFVFPLDILSGIVLLVTAPLIPIFMILIGSLGEALTQRQWQALSRMSAFFLDVIQGLTALKLLGRSREQIEKIARVSEQFRQVTMGVLRVTFLSALALELISTLSTAIVAVQIGLRLLAGQVEFEAAFLILALAPEFYLPLRMLGLRFHASMSGAAAAERIYRVLDESEGVGFQNLSYPPTEGEELAASQIISSPGVGREEGRFSRLPGFCWRVISYHANRGCRAEEPIPQPLSGAERGVLARLVGAQRRCARTQGLRSGFPFSPRTATIVDRYTLIRGERRTRRVRSGPGDERGLHPFANSIIPAPGREAGGSGSGKATVPCLADIHFENVHFAYTPGSKALDGINLDIPVGKTTALVGPSGSGKSTLVGLLLRFYAPQSGRILVNGQELGQIPAARWREWIAWAPQNPYLFNATVMENIRLARSQASQEEIQAAARLANADEFIARLPQGYDTPIGEDGQRLSGGQKQRLALARAFLKDAPLLILDEATAHLDPENERLVQEAARRLMAGRTTLVIAHRLSTVLHADQIIVMQEGKIVQSGRRDELISAPGLYQQLLSASAPHGTPDTESEYPPPSLPDLRGEKGVNWPKANLGDERGQPRQFANNTLLRLLGLLRPFTGLVLLSAALGFAAVSSSVGLMSTAAYILSRAALHPSIADLQVAIVGVRFFGLARGVFRYLERLVSHEVTFRLLAKLRIWFYQQLEPLAPARLLASRSGDLLSRICADIAALESFYVRSVAPPLAAALTALAAWALMLHFNLSLFLALAACMILAGIGLPALIARLAQKPGSALIQMRAGLFAVLVESLQGMADLLSFGQERQQLERIRLHSAALNRIQSQMAALNGAQNALAGLLANLGMWAVLVAGANLVSRGQLDGVYLGALALAALNSFEGLSPLPAAAQSLGSHLKAARRLFNVIAVQPEVSAPARPLSRPQTFTLEVQELSFRYPSSHSLPGEAQPVSIPAPKPYTLQDISFSLQPGKRLAILGASGAGKSTLVGLLLRFWEYQQGQILLGGRDLRQYAPDDLRKWFGVVSQNTYLFNASIGDNLRIAHPEASESAVQRAAEMAQLHEFILSLPQGYDTWVGEHGLRLSAGERQRLAIARALLKDPPLLILDEPSAHLDAINETAVLAAIEKAMAQRSVIYLTHRLAGLGRMDKILVLEKGRIVERGGQG